MHQQNKKKYISNDILNLKANEHNINKYSFVENNGKFNKINNKLENNNKPNKKDKYSQFENLITLNLSIN